MNTFLLDWSLPIQDLEWACGGPAVNELNYCKGRISFLPALAMA